MDSGKKSEKLVKNILAGNNVESRKALEETIQEKIEARIKKVLTSKASKK